MTNSQVAAEYTVGCPADLTDAGVVAIEPRRRRRWSTQTVRRLLDRTLHISGKLADFVRLEADRLGNLIEIQRRCFQQVDRPAVTPRGVRVFLEIRPFDPTNQVDFNPHTFGDLCMREITPTKQAGNSFATRVIGAVAAGIAGFHSLREPQKLCNQQGRTRLLSATELG